MMIFVDDVQFKDEQGFWKYISRSFGKGENGICDKQSLKNALNEREDVVEFCFYDFDDIIPEMKAFANDLKEFMEQCSKENILLRVYFREGAQGL